MHGRRGMRGKGGMHGKGDMHGDGGCACGGGHVWQVGGVHGTHASPPWTQWLTDRCKNITLPQLRLWAVTNEKKCGGVNTKHNLSILYYCTLFLFNSIYKIHCKCTDFNSNSSPPTYKIQRMFFYRYNLWKRLVLSWDEIQWALLCISHSGSSKFFSDVTFPFMSTFTSILWRKVDGNVKVTCERILRNVEKLNKVFCWYE